MSAAIRARAKAGARAAFAAAGDAIANCTLQLEPVHGAYDPATDSISTTWGFEESMPCLAYDDTEERQGLDPTRRRRAFLFLGEDMGDTKGSEEGRVTDSDGDIWEIWMVETDPTSAIWIFYGRAPKPVPEEVEP